MAMAAKHRNPGAGRKPLDESEISGELERKQYASTARASKS